MALHTATAIEGSKRNILNAYRIAVGTRRRAIEFSAFLCLEHTNSNRHFSDDVLTALRNDALNVRRRLHHHDAQVAWILQGISIVILRREATILQVAEGGFPASRVC